MSKIILHIDFNSYFASVEQQANPFLRNKPIAVAGKGKYSIDIYRKNRSRIDVHRQSLYRTVVTTASKEAKALGVKTAMASTEAKKVCPELIIIPGDPRKYGDITNRFMNILERYASQVERFSTDEGFADITVAARDYFGATFIGQQIRRDIRNECGSFATVSIGVANNKTLAKLASESCKPNGLTVIHPDHAISFLDKQDLAAVCGIGPRIEKRLNKMGITDFPSLRNAKLEHLVREFNSYGFFLYDVARGIGSDELSESENPKSVGNSYTFPHDLINEKDIKKQLLAICDKVANRLRKQSFFATHISVYARYKDFGGCGIGKKYNEPMNDGLEIFRNAWQLLKKKWDRNIPVRLLGVSTSALMPTFHMPSIIEKQNKTQNTLHALDILQKKYGSGIWLRAATLKTHFKERTSGWHYDHET